MTEPCPAAFVALAERLADAAGAAIRPYFRTRLAVDDKEDRSPVTDADRAAEDAVRRILAAERPGDGVHGEERGVTGADAEFLWVVDPIDGTKSFLAGRPIFGTLVALLRRGEPILGIIDQPIVGDRWVGAAGRATLFNGRPAEVRPCAALAQAVIGTTGPDVFAPGDLPRFERLARAARYTVWGGDCYGYGLVAAGHLDLVAESGLKLHDFAALVPVVQGAGGIVTDWDGRPLHGGSDGRVLASGDRRAHAEALERLRG